MSTIPVRKRRARSEAEIDDTIDDSFPASDPPSYSRTARSGSPPRGEKLTRVPCEEEAEGNSEDCIEDDATQDKTEDTSKDSKA
jgi:hypothetical protein